MHCTARRKWRRGHARRRARRRASPNNWYWFRGRGSCETASWWPGAVHRQIIGIASEAGVRVRRPPGGCRWALCGHQPSLCGYHLLTAACRSMDVLILSWCHCYGDGRVRPAPPDGDTSSMVCERKRNSLDCVEDKSPCLLGLDIPCI
jgi:hypothetical protein